jgi:hypothetical protein
MRGAFLYAKSLALKTTEEFLAKFACSQEKEDREEKRKSAKKEFKELLKDTEEIDRHSHWSDVKKLIQDDYRSGSGSLISFISSLLCSVTLFCSYFLTFSAVNFFLLITFQSYIYIIFQR